MKKVITVLVAVVIICGVFTGGMIVGEKRTKNNNENEVIVHEVGSVDEALINYLNNVNTYYVNGTVETLTYEVVYKDNGQKWINYFGYEGDEIVAVGGIDWNYLESTLN